MSSQIKRASGGQVQRWLPKAGKRPGYHFSPTTPENLDSATSEMVLNTFKSMVSWRQDTVPGLRTTLRSCLWAAPRWLLR